MAQRSNSPENPSRPNLKLWIGLAVFTVIVLFAIMTAQAVLRNLAEPKVDIESQLVQGVTSVEKLVVGKLSVQVVADEKEFGFAGLHRVEMLAKMLAEANVYRISRL